jgi:hypothetical protein
MNINGIKCCRTCTYWISYDNGEPIQPAPVCFQTLENTGQWYSCALWEYGFYPIFGTYPYISIATRRMLVARQQTWKTISRHGPGGRFIDQRNEVGEIRTIERRPL